MKKLILAFVILSFSCIKAQALAIVDIETAWVISQTLVADAHALQDFLTKLRGLRDAQPQFSYTIQFTTFTVPLTNAQKQDLIGQYNALKALGQNDWNSLP
jgi:hypothetical protein